MAQPPTSTGVNIALFGISIKIEEQGASDSISSVGAKDKIGDDQPNHLRSIPQIQNI